jgi:hypothetical protein
MALVKLKSNGDKASPYFKPFLIGNTADKCLPTRTLLQDSFRHFLLALLVSWGYQNQLEYYKSTNIIKVLKFFSY